MEIGGKSWALSFKCYVTDILVVRPPDYGTYKVVIIMLLTWHWPSPSIDADIKTLIQDPRSFLFGTCKRMNLQETTSISYNFRNSIIVQGSKKNPNNLYFFASSFTTFLMTYCFWEDRGSCPVLNYSWVYKQIRLWCQQNEWDANGYP